MKNRKVLFVEDDRITLAKIRKTVAAEPYQAIFTENGAQAIEILDSEKIDVVVTDLMMPVMDGLELLERLKEKKPEVLRVIVSSASDTDSLLDAINRGSVYRYVLKPYKTDELKIVVRQSLEMSIIQQDRQRILMELEQANRQLHKTVQYRTNQVLDLYNQAEIGKYAAQLVHNLNNPLQAIFGALHISQIALEPSPPDEDLLNRMHSVLLSGADKLEKIIDSVLAHSKNRALYQPEPVDINEIIDDEMEFFNLNATFKNEIEKKLDLQKDLLPVHGNYIQLKQIFDNLIKNAIDAMEATPLKFLRIKTRSSEGGLLSRLKIPVRGSKVTILRKYLNLILVQNPGTKARGWGLPVCGLWSLLTMERCKFGRNVERVPHLRYGFRHTLSKAMAQRRSNLVHPITAYLEKTP